jgi:hypothetical protein
MSLVDDSQWRDLFPFIKLEPEDNRFEIGLVLGGTVSAGAYTAGVLDFLIEALDCWENQKQEFPDYTPNWQVVIKAVSGTSGGGILAATLAKAVSYNFPPVNALSMTNSKNPDNPFYHVWVESVDVVKLFDTSDLNSSGHLLSLLNPTPRLDAAAYIANFNDTGLLASKPRAYIAEPLPIFLTLSNITGIPYKIEWSGGLSQSYVRCADYVRLSVFTKPDQTVYNVRPDEFVVNNPTPSSSDINWVRLSEFGLGTSAFPFGFPPQPLHRPIEHYLNRPMVDPGDGVNVLPSLKKPPIDILALKASPNNILSKEGSDYHFMSVDGGVFDTKPIELARTELAGVLGHNLRNGLGRRAVILIDPFAQAPSLGYGDINALLKDTQNQSNFFLYDEAAAVVSSLRSQSFYDTQDLILAVEPDCYSRFMITPKRDGLVGQYAIATASLGAFGGFLAKEYRIHDYFLGRKNAYNFLKDLDGGLWLPVENPIFSKWKTANPKTFDSMTQIDSQGKKLAPLIPLFGSVASDPKGLVPPYPPRKADGTPAFDPDSNDFQDLLSNRIDKILEVVEPEILSSFWEKLFVDVTLAIAGKAALKKAITDKIKSSLSEWKLND